MSDDRSRYGRDWLNAGLRFTDEQLVSHVEEELPEHGFWTDYGEMAMGAGMQARIDLVESDGAAVYRVTGGFGVTIQGTYAISNERLTWRHFSHVSSGTSRSRMVGETPVSFFQVRTLPHNSGYTCDPPPGIGIRGNLLGCKPDQEVCGEVESVIRV